MEYQKQDDYKILNTFKYLTCLESKEIWLPAFICTNVQLKKF